MNVIQFYVIAQITNRNFIIYKAFWGRCITLLFFIVHWDKLHQCPSGLLCAKIIIFFREITLDLAFGVWNYIKVNILTFKYIYTSCSEYGLIYIILHNHKGYFQVLSKWFREHCTFLKYSHSLFGPSRFP